MDWMKNKYMNVLSAALLIMTVVKLSLDLHDRFRKKDENNNEKSS